MRYKKELDLATDAALEAGELLRREFHRPGGPRGQRAHAEADDEAEWLIRKRLTESFPQYRYRGEETGSIETADDHVWLVDPNDGTSSYLRGARGSAVSIGLVKKGVPVLGVVYAYTAPDDNGDLICWAEDFDLMRNGKSVKPAWDLSSPGHVVLLVSTHRENLMETLLECIHPYRYRAFPSIAYRLALAAVGDGHAAVSWHSPGDWDYAAGHALLRAAGGIFTNENGQEVTYAADGASKVKICFGGPAALVGDLWKRNWHPVQVRHSAKMPSTYDSPFLFARLAPGKAIADPELLSRAQGCLIGQVSGDALGSQVEFQDAATIRNRYPDGLRQMQDGGPFQLMAGQPTDDSELALLLARSIVKEEGYDSEKVAAAYYYWFHRSDPFDVGATMLQALRPVMEENVRSNRAAEAMKANASGESQANGSLMRISPLGIYGYRKPPDELFALAQRESSLTHPHIVCQQCCGLYCIAIAHAIFSGQSGKQVYEAVKRYAYEKPLEPAVLQALSAAARYRPETIVHQGWVVTAFQNAFYQLVHSNSFEDGIVDTVMQGGDTDTNAAIAGALLGAVHGREAIPSSWRNLVLSCRPDLAAGAVQPRPWALWPVDLTNLAELLLLA
ncbi:ADP-ribosylglycohydrolase family protein [bacterium]|nr:ADP-ribosylglycohydrolase family protein [bacterium]